MNDLVKIQALLEDKADCQASLNLLPYEGSPEIKEQNGSRYLYVRKRIAGKLTSTYVDAYSDELYQLLLKNAKDARVLRKRIRQIERELTSLGYKDSELSSRVLQNIDFARANMKSNIYDQAVLEGVGTTFPQTEEILNNGIVNGVKASDVQKILNLKHAWEFILDKDVIQSTSNYYMISHIAKLVNEGFYVDAKRDLTNIKQATTYIGRYLARPAIVEYRVSRYNDKSVTFWYENKKTRKKITVIIDVLEFIGKLTQHIHQKGFRVIRRYGFFTCISVSPFCSICNLVYNNIQITLFNNKFTHRYIFFEDFMIR